MICIPENTVIHKRKTYKEMNKLRKNILSVLVSGAAVVTLTAPAVYGARLGTDYDIEYTITDLEDGTVSLAVSSFSSSVDDLKLFLPSEIDGKTVSAIADGAFYGGMSSVSAIFLPDTVKTIGNDAFHDCTSLTGVNIPEGVTSIGEGAFEGCSNLKFLHLPASLTAIGSDAFSGTALNRIVISQGNETFRVENGMLFNAGTRTLVRVLEEMGSTEGQEVVLPAEMRFLDENALESVGDREVILPENSEELEIEDGAIYNKSGSLLYCNPDKDRDYFRIRTGTKEIGEAAFKGCSNLKRIGIPSTVRHIGAHAFENCTSLVDVRLPKELQALGEAAFAGCSSLLHVTLPDGGLLKEIETELFRDCEKLREISLPESISYICRGAFTGCRSLASVTLPEEVSYIDDRAFDENRSDAEEIEADKSAVLTDRQLEVDSGEEVTYVSLEALDTATSDEKPGDMEDLEAEYEEPAEDVETVFTVVRGTSALRWVREQGYEFEAVRGNVPEKVYTDAETVTQVQTALNAAGYNCGKVDGKQGKNTNAAIVKYRSEHNLEETEQIDDELIDSLGIDM